MGDGGQSRGDGVQSGSDTVAYKRQNTLVIPGLDLGIHA